MFICPRKRRDEIDQNRWSDVGQRHSPIPVLGRPDGFDQTEPKLDRLYRDSGHFGFRLVVGVLHEASAVDRDKGEYSVFSHIDEIPAFNGVGKIIGIENVRY